MSDGITLELTDHPNADQQDVARSVTQSKTSFYAAMRILPEARRNAMYAIYAFCRAVDDIADEPAIGTTKQFELDLWREEIGKLYASGIATKPLARALAQPIRAFGLLRQDFEAVIDGMQMDADRDIRAPSLAELDLYCARVASAVGRLSVRIFGPWEAAADEVADHLGRALQLTNILRDLDEDAARGRLYLPCEVLQRHGIMTVDPLAVLAHPALSAVCAEIVSMAFDHFEKASRAMKRSDRRTMRPARMMGGIYRAILDRTARRGWAPPRHRVKMAKLVKLWIALRCAL